MIKNLYVNGKGYRKYAWYVFFEILYFINKYVIRDKCLVKRCTFKSFIVAESDLRFWLARYLKACIQLRDEQVKAGKLIIGKID